MGSLWDTAVWKISSVWLNSIFYLCKGRWSITGRFSVLFSSSALPNTAWSRLIWEILSWGFRVKLVPLSRELITIFSLCTLSFNQSLGALTSLPLPELHRLLNYSDSRNTKSLVSFITSSTQPFYRVESLRLENTSIISFSTVNSALPRPTLNHATCHNFTHLLHPSRDGDSFPGKTVPMFWWMCLSWYQI